LSNRDSKNNSDEGGGTLKRLSHVLASGTNVTDADPGRG